MKHFYLILSSSLVMGFIAGVYIYFASRTPIEPAAPAGDRAGFEVIADVYGGCASVGCASYRLQDSGAYVYMVRGREGADIRFEDSVSKKRARELYTLIALENFDALVSSTFGDTCPIAWDGPAYRFTIRHEGTSYLIDTCEHDTDSSEVISTLIDYFTIFGLTHETQ